MTSQHRRAPLVTLLVINAIACIGTRVSAIAIPWFVLTTTGSATQTGLVATFEFAPYVVVKALGGPITDRLGQRRVSVVADLGSMIAIGAIPVAHWLDELSLPLLLALVALGGALRGPGDAAKHTAIPMVAEAAGAPLERVTGLYGAIERSSGLVAPALAAVMINSFSSVGAIAVTAGCFGLTAAVALLGMPRRRYVSAEAPAAAEGYLAQLRSGWSFMVKDRLLLLFACMIMITNLLDIAKISVLLPVWARDRGHGVTSIGVLLTCAAVCSVASSLLASWLGARLPRRLTYFVAFAIAGPPPFIALAMDLPLWATATVVAIAGFASGFLNPLIGAILFERIPGPLLGRVTSLIDAVAWAGMPAGGLVAAALIGGFGLAPAFLVCGTAYALAIVLPAFARGASFDRPAASEPAENARL